MLHFSLSRPTAKWSIKLFTCNTLNHIQLLSFSSSGNFLPRRLGGWGWPRGRGWQLRTVRSSWGQCSLDRHHPMSGSRIPDVMLTSHILARQGAPSVTSLLCASWSPTERSDVHTPGGSSAPDVMVVMCCLLSRIPSSLMLIKFLRFYLEFPHIMSHDCCFYLVPPVVECGYIPEIMLCVKIIAAMKSLGDFYLQAFSRTGRCHQSSLWVNIGLCIAFYITLRSDN